MNFFPWPKREKVKVNDNGGLENFIHTFLYLKPSNNNISSISSAEKLVLAEELGWRSLIHGSASAIAASTAESWFYVTFNNVNLLLPRYTVMTMIHCLVAQANGALTLDVETAHWSRMRAEIVPNTLFLDIGAATGAMTVPYALNLPENCKIISFEPSNRARNYLEATLLNGADMNKVSVLPYAISDQQGNLEFMEFPEASAGQVAFLPEASRLKVDEENLYPGAVLYNVPVTTLDVLLPQFEIDKFKKTVVKIDVEGYELEVLKGAQELIRRCRPIFYIDIHNAPNSSESTGPSVRDFLQEHSYQIEQMGHVFSCAPKA